MVFAGFFISSARYVAITVESPPPPGAVFVTGNFDVSGATLMYKDQLVVTPTDIEFKTDGTKLFVAIEGSTSIYEYYISNAWDLTTLSADATTSLSVSNMTQVNSIDFNRNGTKLYACGSGNVAEFSMTSAYDLTTASSQSTLDINVYSGSTIYGACFSNSESNNYLHFTSSNINHVNTISTIKIEEPLSGSTFVGRSANVVPLINTVVAPDLHTTRTLEVSGGGTRFYQIYRNTDLSNVNVIEFKLGTPHDASTLTSATQIEDYYDLADQTGGTFLYDTTNSLKIKPDGSEMFLSGTNFFVTELSTSTTGNTPLGHSRDLTYVTVGASGGNGSLFIYKYNESNETFGLDQSISTIDGNLLYQGQARMSNDGTLLIASFPGGHYSTINQYNGSTWSTLFKTTTNSRIGEAGIDLSTSENLVVINDGSHNKFHSISNIAGTWTLTTYTIPGTNKPSSVSITDESVLAIGEQIGRYVYLYSNVNGTWTLDDTIVSPDTGYTNYAAAGATELNGNSTVLVVGAYLYSSSKGRVYVYEKSGGSWSLSHTIDSPTGTAEAFGSNTSINESGTRIAVGAYSYSSNKGRVYVFDKLGNTWTLTNTIDTPTSAKIFGVQLQLSWDGNRLAARETSTIRYYTSPQNTQTYSLDVPTPYIHLTGNTSNTWDILAGNYNVDRSGTSEDFYRTDERIKTDTHSIECFGGNPKLDDFSITEIDGNKNYFTACGWVNSSGSNFGYITLFSTENFEISSSGDTGFLFAIAVSTRTVMIWKFGGSYSMYQTVSTLTSTTDELYNKWWHIAVCIPVAAYTTDTPVIFVNGEEYTTARFTAYSPWNTGGSYSSGQDIFLGKYNRLGTPYTVYIDDFRWYNKKIDSKIIKKIYLDSLAPHRAPAFHLTFEDNTGADILPSGASLGGTSLSTLQSNTVTYQGDYVGDITDSTSNVQIQNWSTFYAPFSFSMWLYLIPNSTGYKTILITSGYYTASKGIWYTIGYSNSTQPYQIAMFISDGSSINLQEISPAVHYLDYRWSHHTMSWDGSTVRIYVDGQLTHSGTNTQSMGAIGQDINLFQYLHDGPYSGNNSSLSGYVDDIRIYDYVLDPQEVEYLYTSSMVHTDQSFYLSYDQSNVYDYYDGSIDVAATGAGQYNQDPGSKIGTHSGEYPQGTTGTVVPTWSGLSSATVLTFSVWVFPTVLTGTHTLFATENFGSGSTGIGAQQLVTSMGNLQVRLLTRVSSSDRYRYVNLTSVSNYINKWTHFVFVYSSVSSASKIFVNGAEQTLTASSTWSFSGVPVGDDLRIGNYNGTSTNEFSGALDDFRFFKRELNTQEVSAMYREYTQSRIYTINVINDIPPPQSILFIEGRGGYWENGAGNYSGGQGLYYGLYSTTAAEYTYNLIYTATNNALVNFPNTSYWIKYNRTTSQWEDYGSLEPYTITVQNTNEIYLQGNGGLNLGTFIDPFY